jgi:hypothetical protein
MMHAEGRARVPEPGMSSQSAALKCPTEKLFLYRPKFLG